MECECGVEGVHEDHCLHDLRKGEGPKPERPRDGYGQVCCWCGDLFLSRGEGDHGEYEPGLSRSVKERREAAGRKEARLKLKENREHAKDYGSGFLSEDQLKTLEAIIQYKPSKRSQ